MSAIKLRPSMHDPAKKHMMVCPKKYKPIVQNTFSERVLSKNKNFEIDFEYVAKPSKAVEKIEKDVVKVNGMSYKLTADAL